MPLITIRVLDSAEPPQPVDGVWLRIYDAEGLVFHAEAHSGDLSAGEAQFDLDEGEYQLRARKIGVSISPPARYLEVGADDDQRFDLAVETHEWDTAEDARLCRCTGYFTTPEGRANRRAGVRMTLDGTMVIDNHAAVGEISRRTGEDGKLVIDLYRNCVYEATVTGNEDSSWEVLVPDSPWTDLNELLFPVISSVTPVDPGTPEEYPEGFDPVENQAVLTTVQEVTIPLAVVMSSKADFSPRVHGDLSVILEFVSSDDTVAQVGIVGGTEDVPEASLFIRAVGAGSASVVARYKRPTGRVPERVLQFTPIAVTVTEEEE